MYLRITNNGEVPTDAFRLVGASTKRNDDSKIGMFGSGNKFGLAYLFRNNYDVQIYSGKRKIKIDLIEKKFGNEDIKVLAFDNVESSITTDMGPKWTLWQSIREFYSNAVDEGLVFFEFTEAITSVEGETNIYISTSPELKDFMNNVDKYFSNNRDFIFKGEEGKIFSKMGKAANIYRQGIRCYESTEESVFDYDLSSVEINESRLLKHAHVAQSKCWNLLMKCDSKSIIVEFLETISGKKNLWECNGYINWDSSNPAPSFAWKEALEGKFICPISLGGWVKKTIQIHTYFIPAELYKVLIASFGSEYAALKMKGKGHIKYDVLEPDEFELNSISRVMDFFNEVRYPIEEPISVVSFYIDKKAKQEVLGMAEDGKILISRLCFEEGLAKLAAVIYEEHIHLKHGCKDETRHMQNVLIKETMTYMKKSNSINL